MAVPFICYFHICLLFVFKRFSLLSRTDFCCCITNYDKFSILINIYHFTFWERSPSIGSFHQGLKTAVKMSPGCNLIKSWSPLLSSFFENSLPQLSDWGPQQPGLPRHFLIDDSLQNMAVCFIVNENTSISAFCLLLLGTLVISRLSQVKRDHNCIWKIPSPLPCNWISGVITLSYSQILPTL